jgi:hypothetical protein
VREEIGGEITPPRYLATLENIFVYEGAAGHEIVRVYEAALTDRSFYERDAWEGVEGEERFPVVWKPLDEFRRGAKLYPDGLLALVDEGAPPS